MKPKVLIITGNGLNCEDETAYAFELAGAKTDKIHLNDILSKEKSIKDYQILSFIGGFSYGDHISAGAVLKIDFKYALREDIQRFIEDEKLIIGICNGFQTMVRLGILPAFEKKYFNQLITLTFNDSGKFEDRWVNLKVNKTKCVFTKDIEYLFLPVRHGEGKLYAIKGIIRKLKRKNQIVLQYADGDKPTMEYPKNPNGSLEAIAGICDETGRIFGIMPHPEAYLSSYNHPLWTRQKIENKLPKEGQGVKIFRNAVEYFK